MLPPFLPSSPSHFNRSILSFLSLSLSHSLSIIRTTRHECPECDSLFLVSSFMHFYDYSMLLFFFLCPQILLYFSTSSVLSWHRQKKQSPQSLREVLRRFRLSVPWWRRRRGSDAIYQCLNPIGLSLSLSLDKLLATIWPIFFHTMKNILHKWNSL